MSYQQIVLVGNLGTDPEMKYTASGVAVAKMPVATNRRWSDGEGETKEETTWFRVVVFGKQAEACHQYLEKGRQVLVEGRISTSQYEDKDGITRYGWEVVASTVRFLGGSGGAGGGEASRREEQLAGTHLDDSDIPF